MESDQVVILLKVVVVIGKRSPHGLIRRKLKTDIGWKYFQEIPTVGLKYNQWDCDLG